MSRTHTFVGWKGKVSSWAHNTQNVHAATRIPVHSPRGSDPGRLVGQPE